MLLNSLMIRLDRIQTLILLELLNQAFLRQKGQFFDTQQVFHLRKAGQTLESACQFAGHRLEDGQPFFSFSLAQVERR